MWHACSTAYAAIHIARDERYTTVCGFAWKTKKQKKKKLQPPTDEESKACSFPLSGGREALTNGIERGDREARNNFETISFFGLKSVYIYMYIIISICSFLDEMKKRRIFLSLSLEKFYSESTSS